MATALGRESPNGRDCPPGPSFPLKWAILKRITALNKSDSGEWSLAVLVPAKRLMLQASDYLSSGADGLPPLAHEVALDTEAPALAAILIAALLEGGKGSEDIAKQLIANLCQHIRGRKGNDAPSQDELKLVEALSHFLHSGKVRGKRRERIIEGAKALSDARIAMVLTGDPAEDWLAMRRLLSESGAPEYRQVAEDARYLRLLHKGAALRSRLSELWRTHGHYTGASAAVGDALLQEHFSASLRDWRGIHVMTIHKSKGKEFTEVVIFEGVHHGRIVWDGATTSESAQAKLALRVAATRAMNRATILTPRSNSCSFL